MGVTMLMVEKLAGLGLFRDAKAILDIGSSNLYSAEPQQISAFIESGRTESNSSDAEFAQRLSAGSLYDASSGGTNASFLGELIERAGMRYDAIDIADGYKTTLLDLNHQDAPKNFINAFDVTINSGTTEHILNQYNAFKVIHDSTRVGGYIVHAVPCSGYSNHGYVTYTSRCFFDLAGYNGYEVVDFAFESPGGANDLYQPLKDYASYFPHLEDTYERRGNDPIGRKIAEMQILDLSLTIVLRKVKDAPFMGAIERSTSVGLVPESILALYEKGGKAILRRFWSPKAH